MEGSALGQRVATLSESDQAANTARSFNIDGQGLSSGLYFYRVGFVGIIKPLIHDELIG